MLAAGVLDPTFGVDGIVTSEFYYYTSINNVAYDAVATPAGKVLLAGYYGREGGMVVQLNADGSVDTGFGGNGIVRLPGPAYDVAVQSDGKFVVIRANDLQLPTTYFLARYNADGTLDTTFDDDGWRTLNGTHDGVAVQNDGKIIVVGQLNGQFALARYDVDGTPDTTFDGDGHVLSYLGEGGQAYGVVVQDDGKIVVVGWAQIGTNKDFAVVRYNSDGSFDTGFDGDGWVLTNFGTSSDVGYSVTLDPSGRIVAVGSTSNDSFAVARFLADGALDNSFGSDGRSTITPAPVNGYGGGARDVVIRNDGKILVAGGSRYDVDGNGGDIAIVQFNDDGSSDTSFAVGGIQIVHDEYRQQSAVSAVKQSDGNVLVVGGGAGSDGNGEIKVVGIGVTPFVKSVELMVASWESAQAVAVQQDGRIVVAGYTNVQTAIVTRYNIDGTLDPSFGSGGTTALATDLYSFEQVRGIAVQDDGKIVVVGNDVVNGAFRMVRVTSDGVLDTSFGSNGRVVTSFGQSAAANAVAIQDDGKIVVAGSQYNGSNTTFALARYNVDGLLDSSFDGDGKVTTAIGASDVAYGIVINDDGKIVVAGSTGAGSSADFALVRYNSDGSVDNSFGGNGTGRVTTAIGTGGDTAYALALQDDGKLIAAGTNGSRAALARYNTNGTLDNTFGVDGKAVYSEGNAARGIAVQQDGRIVVVGSVGGLGVARLNPDGSRDESFGSGGIVVVPPGLGSRSLLGLALDGNENIVVAGYVYNEESQTNDFLLARVDGSSAGAVIDPVFTSPDVASVPENTTAVLTVTATDASLPPEIVTFSLAGGADQARFAITGEGSLSFVAAPDFEMPLDADADNTYEVTVQADDGHGGMAMQTIQVTVTPVNDNDPVFMSADVVYVVEGTTSVVVVAASDADLPAQSLSYSILGGADRNQFQLAGDGTLSFSSPPDYDAPADANGDNLYVVVVQASDGERFGVQAILVYVTEAGLAGDYNHDNVVDAADYTVWRDMNGAQVTSYSGADGNGDGVVDDDDYQVWKENFGSVRPLAAGSGAAAVSRAVVSEAALTATAEMAELSRVAGSNEQLNAAPIVWGQPVSVRRNPEGNVNRPLRFDWAARHDRALVAWLAGRSSEPHRETSHFDTDAYGVDACRRDLDSADDPLELAFAAISD